TVNSARRPLLGLVFACILLTGRVLGGQTLVVTQAPPPPPPPPPAAAAGSPGSPLTPVAPPRMDIPPEQLPRFEVESVKKFEGRVTSSNLRTPGGGRITISNLPLRTILMQAFG